jgi:hypothetical protein
MIIFAEKLLDDFLGKSFLLSPSRKSLGFEV